jgi:hypothetical protein
MSVREIILGGLLLPLRVYFQPIRFRRMVAALAPELPEDYSLLRARRKLRDPAFRRSLIALDLQALVALLWSPLLAGLCQAIGLEVQWYGVALGVALGVACGVWRVAWRFPWWA